MGHLQEDPDQSLIEWQTQVLNAYVGRPVVEKLRGSMTRTSQPAPLELAQAVSGAVLFFDLRGFTLATST